MPTSLDRLIPRHRPEGGSYECHCHCRRRAIYGNYRGHQAESKAIEHPIDDVDDRGWLRTSDVLHGGVAPARSRLLVVREMPHSGKPDELIDAFGISARHIVEAVNAIP
jgi:hypothetical protein